MGRKPGAGCVVGGVGAFSLGINLGINIRQTDDTGDI